MTGVQGELALCHRRFRGNDWQADASEVLSLLTLITYNLVNCFSSLRRRENQLVSTFGIESFECRIG